MMRRRKATHATKRRKINIKTFFISWTFLALTRTHTPVHYRFTLFFSSSIYQHVAFFFLSRSSPVCSSPFYRQLLSSFFSSLNRWLQPQHFSSMIGYSQFALLITAIIHLLDFNRRYFPYLKKSTSITSTDSSLFWRTEAIFRCCARRIQVKFQDKSRHLEVILTIFGWFSNSTSRGPTCFSSSGQVFVLCVLISPRLREAVTPCSD